MTSSIYFKLFACCIPVKGASRSIVCDIQRGEYILIPNGVYEILTTYKNYTIEEIKRAYDYEYNDIIDDYFNELLKKELGFWTKEPHLFPDINLEWKSPRKITNAIIDIDENSNHDYLLLFQQLDALGCESVQFRYYTPTAFSQIKSTIHYIKYTRLRSAELMIFFQQNLTEDSIRELYKEEARISLVVLHSAPWNNIIEIEANKFLVFSSEIVVSSDCCGKIKSDYFSININVFTEAQQYNTCLNRKIGIDVKGNIKNCPSFEKSFGNMSNVTLNEVIQQEEFKRFWKIHKDQIEVCKDCEFRYICTDCRAYINEPSNIYSKPSKCTYDPYTATWK